MSSYITISDFYCTKCGKKGMPIPRKIGAQRQGGHLKRLFCLNCQEEVNHVEVRPFGAYQYEDFKQEFELGRFDKDGQRIPLDELLDCSNRNCKYNINGKCWNGNEQYNCNHRIEKGCEENE